MVLITAHTELEHVTLERELARFKRHTDQRWAELVYDGLWYSPLKAALDTFDGQGLFGRLNYTPTKHSGYGLDTLAVAVVNSASEPVSLASNGLFRRRGPG